MSEGTGYTTMDYVKVIGGLFLTGLAIYRIGDLKMILYVLVIGVLVVGSILVIPNLQGSPIQNMVLEALGELPGLIQQFLGGGSII